MNRDTWILNGLIVTQDEGRRVLPAHLHIRDGKITQIAKSKPRRLPASAKIVDAAGLVILPGFVQAHVHLCQTLFRNQADDLDLMDWLTKKIWVLEAAHTEETLFASARLGIHELLSTGTTCVLDMGTVRHTGAILEAVRESGIRASVGKCLMDHPQTTPLTLREPTRQAIEEASSIFKHWHGREADRIRVSYAPRFVVSCSEQLLIEIANLSREQNALVHTHASENQKEIALVKSLVGAENIEYLHRIGLTSARLVLAHCIWLNQKEKKILQSTGTHVVHCPSSNLKLASGIAPIPELLANSVNVALGADGAPCNNNLNMFTEMRLAALIHKPGSGPKSMPALQILDMATRNGAKALGWQDQIGSIEIGKCADLIALDLSGPENTVFNPNGAKTPTLEAIASSIVYSTSPQRLRWSAVNGRFLYQNGKVLTIPTAQLLKQVAVAQRKIQRSLTP